MYEGTKESVHEQRERSTGDLVELLGVPSLDGPRAISCDKKRRGKEEEVSKQPSGGPEPSAKATCARSRRGSPRGTPTHPRPRTTDPRQIVEERRG